MVLKQSRKNSTLTNYLTYLLTYHRLGPAKSALIHTFTVICIKQWNLRWICIFSGSLCNVWPLAQCDHIDTLFVVLAPANPVSNETVELKVLTFSFKCVLDCSHPHRVSSVRLVANILLPSGACIKSFSISYTVHRTRIAERQHFNLYSQR